MMRPLLTITLAACVTAEVHNVDAPTVGAFLENAADKLVILDFYAPCPDAAAVVGDLLPEEFPVVEAGVRGPLGFCARLAPRWRRANRRCTASLL